MNSIMLLFYCLSCSFCRFFFSFDLFFLLVFVNLVGELILEDNNINCTPN